MKFNKKTMITTMAIVLSGATIAVSALSMSSTLQGYDAFKEKLVSKMTTVDYNRNYTKKEQYILKKSDLVMLTANRIEQKNQYFGLSETYPEFQMYQYYSKIEIVRPDDTVISNEYWNNFSRLEDNISITKSNNDDTYYRQIVKSGLSDEEKQALREEEANTDVPAMNTNTDDNDSAVKNFVEALINIVAGDTKNYFTLKDDTITLELEGAQIPEIAQLGLPAFVSKLKSDVNIQVYKPNSIEALLSQEILALNNLKIEKIYSELSKNDSKQIFAVTMSGYDQNGKKEVYSIEAELIEENKGTTVITFPDLTGKTVVDDIISSH